MRGGARGTGAASSGTNYTKALADLFSCVGSGDIATAKALLDAHTEDGRRSLLSSTNPAGITLLQQACHAGRADGVSMLLEEGADPSWKSTKGSTALHFACNAGHYDCAKRLLRAGVDVDAGNANGTTPLIISAFGAHASCVRLLLEQDADPNVRDNLGRRAGDSLCGLVVERLATGGGAASRESVVFSETRAILDAARAERAAKAQIISGSGGTSTSVASNACRGCLCVVGEGAPRDGPEESLPPPAQGGEGGGVRKATTDGEASPALTSPSHPSGSSPKASPMASPLRQPRSLFPAAPEISPSGKDGDVRGGAESGESRVNTVHRPCEHPSFALPSPSATVVTSAITSAGDSSDTPSAASCGTPGRNGKIPPVPLFSADSGSRQGCDTSEHEDGEVMEDAEDGGGEVDRARSDCRHNPPGDSGRSCGCFETPLRGRFRLQRQHQQEQQEQDPRLDLHLRSPLHVRSRGGLGKGSKEECVCSDGGGCGSSSGRSTPAAPRTGASSLPRWRRPADEANEDMEEVVGLDGKGRGRRGGLPTMAHAASATAAAAAAAATGNTAASASSSSCSSSRSGHGTAFGSGASESDGDRDPREAVRAAEPRRVQELKAAAVAPYARRDSRYRDGRSQRSRTNANKRQRAGTSSLPAPHLHHQHHSCGRHFDRGGYFADGDDEELSPRGQPTFDGGMKPNEWNELRRLRARAAALERESTSLAAKHTSLALEKARQAGVLRSQVAAAENKVERLTGDLGDAQEKIEVQAREIEELRLVSERQEGLLSSRSQALQQALDRLESIGFALAQERSLNPTRCSHGNLSDSQDGGDAVSVGHGSSDAAGGNTLGEEEGSRDARGSRRNMSNSIDSAGNDTTSGSSSGGSSSGGSGSDSDNRSGNGSGRSSNCGNGGGVNGSSSSSSSNSNNSNNNRTSGSTNDSGTNAQQTVDGAGAGVEADEEEEEEETPSMSVDAVVDEGHSSDGSDDVILVERTEAGGRQNVTDELQECVSDTGDRDISGGGAMVDADPSPMRDVDAEPSGAVAAAVAAAGEAEEVAEGAASPRRGALANAVIFSHQQIYAACQGFPDSAIVGRGGFGPVFRGHLLGQDVAVKRLDGYGLQGLNNFLREVQVLTTCRHAHLVPLLGVCLDPIPMLVYPFVGKSLEWHLKEPERRAALDWRKRLSVALAVSKGLQYLHQPQAGAWGKPAIVHRDVKTENILMDDDLCARLSDVGIARPLGGGGAEATTRLVGTWGYIDPEYQDTGVLSPSSDVYSLGVVLLELLTGLPAHSSELRPSSLVDRVSGKQLSDCLDQAISWPDERAVVAFAKEAWQCISYRGDDRPRLSHIIERLERLQAGDEARGIAAVTGGISDEVNSNNSSSVSSASSGSASSINVSLNRDHGGSSAYTSNIRSNDTDTTEVPQLAAVAVPAPQQPEPLSMALARSAASTIRPSSEAASTAARAANQAAAAARAATEAAAVAAVAAAAVAVGGREAAEAATAVRTSPEGSDASAIVGTVGSPPPSSGHQPPRHARRDCMICASAPVQTRFLPCRHSLACQKCAYLLRARGNPCPVDRARIDSVEAGQFQVTYEYSGD